MAKEEPLFAAHTGKPLSPAPSRVTVYDPDGVPLKCWPVDARELVASGHYSLTEPIKAAEVVESVPVAVTSAGSSSSSHAKHGKKHAQD